jgi:hypothetical protein
MEALQEALMNEQKITMEKLTRERMDVDRVKVKFNLFSN